MIDRDLDVGSAADVKVIVTLATGGMMLPAILDALTSAAGGPAGPRSPESTSRSSSACPHESGGSVAVSGPAAAQILRHHVGERGLRARGG
jgi:hypothetical protein